MLSKYLIGAALVAAPLLASSAPASAITSRQYATQGYGVYTTSKGVPQRWGYRRHPYGHYGWRPRPRLYGGPYGYPPYGYPPYGGPYGGYAPY